MESPWSISRCALRQSRPARVQSTPPPRAFRRLRPQVFQTNDLGEFRIFGLAPGEYVLAASPQQRFGFQNLSIDTTLLASTFYPGVSDTAAAQTIIVTAGETVGGVEFRLLTTAGFKVSGVVVDQTGAPVAGAMVMLRGDPRSAVAIMGPVGQSSSDANGRFVLGNVPSGSYSRHGHSDVRLQDEWRRQCREQRHQRRRTAGGTSRSDRGGRCRRRCGWCNDRRTASSMKTGGPVPFLFLSLLLAGALSSEEAPQEGTQVARLSGRVVEERTGAPISSAQVVLLPQPRTTSGPPLLAITDQDGRYTFEGVAPGRYRVDVLKAGILPAADPANVPTVTLAAGQIIDDWNVPVQRGGAIAGRILDPFGEPLVDVTVRAMRRNAPGAGPSQAIANSTPSGDLRTRAIPTNDLGEFRVFGLASGEYVIAASPQPMIGLPEHLGERDPAGLHFLSRRLRGHGRAADRRDRRGDGWRCRISPADDACIQRNGCRRRSGRHAGGGGKGDASGRFALR